MSQQKIPLIDLGAQYRSIQPEIDAAIRSVLESGQFILGGEVAALEQAVAAYLGVQHSVGVASGSDALMLALRALEIGSGDEVILPAYTFFATAGAVLHVGATPVLVDIDPLTYGLNVEQARARITPRTKAILAVHLFGHPADMHALLELAEENNLPVVEDNAQALGASYAGHKTGSFGRLACLSFFPSKNLGAYGDGGMVVTGNPLLAEKVRMLRAHGWRVKYYPEMLGYNSRLDALQAAILRAKLPHLDAWNERRRAIASVYSQRLAGYPLGLPSEQPLAQHVYHLYVIRVTENTRLLQPLHQQGIASDIYYPQPLHLSRPLQSFGYQQGDFPEAERASRETLAIPLYPEMTAEQIERVVTGVQKSLEKL